MLLVGDVFILQVTGVFTRICSGATLVAVCDSVYGFALLRGGGGREAERHKCMCLTKETAGSENPKGFSVYL
jgi:hypothetical protein